MEAEPSLCGDTSNEHKENQLHSCLAARGEATFPGQEPRHPAPGDAVPAGMSPGDSQVCQEAALVPEQAAVPEPDEENQIRPSRLRFGPRG